jgi:hypothetical protein
VKLTSRVGVAALTITVVTTALLAFSGPAFASATPPAPNPALFHTWANTNAATRNVVDIVVTRSKGGILVDGFGACSPNPCEWGNIPGTVFGKSVSSVTGNSFEANWNFGFARTVLLATLTKPGGIPTLVVKEFTTFTDKSGRSNFTVTEKFVHAHQPITPTASGTAATDYPLGDSVTPVPSLLGTWHNTSPGGNIKKIVLAKLNGKLTVHAFGNCVPTLCNWGVVRGITFGTNVSSVSGRVFLAPYKFTFKNALLSGSVNRTGTTLTVQANSEFTDHSGRSNYVIVETFKH